MKKSAKTNGWSKRWFVLNEKTGKVCKTVTDKYYGMFFHVTKLKYCVFVFLFCLMVKMKAGIYAPVHVLAGKT